MTSLIDTPKRQSLQDQARLLRVDLKEFERTYATEHNGQKPGKGDIKANPDIAAKYRHYNKVRDVLAGNADLETLSAKSPCRKQHDSRAGNATTSATGQRKQESTPHKTRLHPGEIDPYDAPTSASPKPAFLSVVGPTPQRNGKVLGLFDLLTNSGSRTSVYATPSSNRKRKIDALAEEEPRHPQPDLAQTPRKSVKQTGDILEHLSGNTSRSGAATGRRKHGKTPTSDGKKFMLSQFFATPTAVRYGGVLDGQENSTPAKTPLRSWVLSTTPEQLPKSEPAPDATPAYLKRSFSFKERLLSASSPMLPSHRPASSKATACSPPIVTRPRTLRRYRSAPKPLSEIAADLRKMEDEQHDDDLEAMRELEGNEVNVLVGNDQNASEGNQQTNNAEEPRKWKKKGQKRTTRRTMMRPTTMKPKAAPKFISVENNVGDQEQPAAVKESQVSAHGSRNADDSSEDELVSGHTVRNVHPENESYISEEDVDYGRESDGSHDEFFDRKSTKRGKKKGNPEPVDPAKLTKKVSSAKQKPGTINPNAQSHMNFRSLKIRNRNSKAKGASRGRFGRGRR